MPRAFTPERERMCAQKQRHKRREWAELIAKEAAARFGKRMSVYHCPYCQGWHVASRKDTRDDVSF